MKKLLVNICTSVALFVSFCAAANVFGQSSATGTDVEGNAIPHLQRKGDAVRLIVDGRPFLMLSGETHNSSSTNLDYIDAVFSKLNMLGLNSAITPITWELFEPIEGEYDFALVDGIVGSARRHDLRLTLLWFGSWKNGVSSYVPEWVKRDTKRFPRCQGSSNRNTKDVLTPLCEENRNADARAFAALMRHIKEIDGEQHTVIMMQVENEVGIKPEPRDLSQLGDDTFNSPVPKELIDYLVSHRDELHPELLDRWQSAGGKTEGTWPEVFGASPGSDEVFSAWHYAKYINEVTRAGKAEYPLPMYVNAWLRGDGAAIGTYPTGGPVAHMHDVWRAAAPDIDFFAPDIYDSAFKEVCLRYTRNGNPLMIPEASYDDAAAARAYWAFGEHDAMCFAPFGIESIDGEHPLTSTYRILDQLMPMIVAAQGTDRMIGIYRQRNDEPSPDGPLVLGDWNVNLRYLDRDIPKDTRTPIGGIVIQTGDDEFIVAGYGFSVNFGARTPGLRNTAILSVELGHIEDGRFVGDLRLNGDETGANYVAKIPMFTRNKFLGVTEQRILRVKVYRHD